jgi:hypothetical protein
MPSGFHCFIRGKILIMAVAPAPMLISSIPFLRPLDQGKDRLAELFPVFGQGILDPWRNL